jgi:hypothetical protein
MGLEQRDESSATGKARDAWGLVVEDLEDQSVQTDQVRS